MIQAGILAILSLSFLLLPSGDLVAQEGPVTSNETTMTGQTDQVATFYDFRVEALDGSEFDFSSLNGKRILIVNTASKCGFTPQYDDLQKLFEEYKDRNFIIIGFPSNNFMSQEPGSNEEIAEFCRVNYGVTFPMMSKSSVKGKDQNEVYAWLTQKEKNGVSDAKVKWNFNKFLIDENGHWVAWYPSSVKPDDERIRAFAAGESW